MRRVLVTLVILVCALVLVAGGYLAFRAMGISVMLAGRNAKSEYISEPREQAPVAPDPAGLATGDPAKRPTISGFRIDNDGQEQGWYLVLQDGFRIEADVEGADKVRFYGYTPGTAEELDPIRNGILQLGRLDETVQSNTRWYADGRSPGGRVAALYAVAENQFGRTVSPVLFVAWVPEQAATDRSQP